MFAAAKNGDVLSKRKFIKIVFWIIEIGIENISKKS